MRSLRDAVLLVTAAALVVALPLLGLRASFVRPWGLALYGLALPLVLLHVLKPRRTRRTVGSVLLWREAIAALEARTPFRRLLRNLALFLELLALAALATALATPRVRGGAGGGKDVILVIDASASMKTRDGPGGRTRFETAVAEARARTRSLRSGERALLLVATPHGARTTQGWTEDPAAVEDALAALAPTDGPAELGDALLLAAAAARPLGPRAEVVLLSDGGGPAPPSLDLRGLRYRALGSTEENVGITGLELRAEEEPGRFSVLVALVNAGVRERCVWVEIHGAGPEPLAARKLVLAPRARAATVLEARLEPGVARARLVAAPGDPEVGRALDLLPEDDEASFIVPPREAALAVYVAAKPFPEPGPVERALLASGLLKVERRTVEGLAALPQPRLVVLDGVLPTELPRATCLLIAPPRDTGPVALGDPVVQGPIAGWDREERLLRFCSLDDVEVGKARRLHLSGTARPLLSDAVGPLGATWTEHERTRVVLGFDLADGNWPIRLSFPIFIRNLVLAALEEGASCPPGVVRAGAPVALVSPPGVTSVTVKTPTGKTVAVPVEDERATFAATDEAGVYGVRAGTMEGAFAVAVLDEGESRVGPRPILDLGGDPIASQATLEEGEREVPGPFLLLALAAVTLEGFAFHRRW